MNANQTSLDVHHQLRLFLIAEDGRSVAFDVRNAFMAFFIDCKIKTKGKIKVKCSSSCLINISLHLR